MTTKIYLSNDNPNLSDHENFIITSDWFLFLSFLFNVFFNGIGLAHNLMIFQNITISGNRNIKYE